MSSKFKITEVAVKEQTRELFFTVNEKSKYKIPSKLFPLANKKQSGIFAPNSTVPFENEAFFKLVNQLTLEIGACYTNTEKLLQVAEFLGLDAYYFSGWLFRFDDMPKHHAWLIIKHGNGAVSIVDSLKENLFRKALDYAPKDKELNRESYALAVKEAMKNHSLNTEQIIIGQVMEGFFYVGSEDKYRNAQKTFQDLVKKFPNHPAYQEDGDNMQGRSKLQEEMARIGIE